MTTLARFDDDGFARQSVMLMGAVLVASILAGAMGGAAAALTVAWMPLAIHALFYMPVHLTARVLLVLGLFIEPPEMVPGASYWISPLDPVNRLFYSGLKNFGIPGASLPLFFVAAVVLFLRARQVSRDIRNPTPPRPAVRAIELFFWTLMALEAYGIVRGGAIAPSFFQILHMTTRAVVALGMLYAIRGEADVRAYGTIIVAVACTRGLLVMWVYFIVCMPQGITPEYATTHGDSVTFDAAVLIVVASYMELRTRRAFWRMAAVASYLLIVIVMNNRRLAFVGMGGGLATMLLWLPNSPSKKLVKRLILRAGPVLLVYFLIGQSSTSSLFAPARLVLSTLTQEDASSDSRDIENDNLIATLRDHPITGSGFGFEYKEVVLVYDIAEYFPLYRYIAHNQVLWLIAICGVFGFALLWRSYAYAAFFASRGYFLAASEIDRAAMLAVIGIVVVCITGDWGDQGLTSYPSLMVFSAAFAAACNVCARAEHVAATQAGTRYLTFKRG